MSDGTRGAMGQIGATNKSRAVAADGARGAKTVMETTMNKVLSCGLSLVFLAMSGGCAPATDSADDPELAEESVGAARQGVSTAHFGYLLADQPLAASYTPALDFNSQGLGDTVARLGMGYYAITFRGLLVFGANPGVAHATAVGTGAAHCKVANMGGRSGSANESVWVRCYDPAGNPVDTKFAASFATPADWAVRHAFVRADQPSAALYTPGAAYQYNSTGAAITVTRGSIGVYTVKIPGMATAMAFSTPPDGGAAVVTAFGDGTARCKTSGWSVSGADSLVSVRCLDSNSNLVDSQFELTFHSHETIFGHLGVPRAYFLADQPAAASYVPATFYQNTASHPAVTVVRNSTGNYTVTLPELGFAGGIVHVTADGTDASQCKVASWGQSGANGADEVIQIRCFSGPGSLTDSKFAVSYAAYPK